MRYVSLFSGIEAASAAWGPLGWEPVAFSEVEPFCCELLAQRFPDVPNLGDVSKVDWTRYEGSVDVVIGGSPCQAFSVAGRRDGLMDERGQLMLEYARAVREIRPRWVIWENVPGVLSQDGGRAFGTLLGELEDCGYSLCWRVLDAQFFGVAQRRRRVFLVGHPRAGCAAAVLFDPASLRWDFATGKEAREALAGAARRRAGTAGGAVAFKYSAGAAARTMPAYDDGTTPTLVTEKPPAVAFVAKGSGEVSPVGGDGKVAGSLSAQPGMTQTLHVCVPTRAVRTANAGADGCGAHKEAAHALDPSGPEAVCYGINAGPTTRVGEDVSPTLTANRGGGSTHAPVCYGIYNDSTPQVNDEVAPTLRVGGDGSTNSMVAYGIYDDSTPKVSEDVYPTIRRGGDGGTHQAVAVPCMTDTQSGSSVEDDACGAITAHSAKDAPVVAVPSGRLTPWDTQARRVYSDNGVAPTLDARDGKAGQGAMAVLTKAIDYIVRRLMPVECERLQGFPDGWTEIAFRGRPADECPDSPRYKALGNSMAVPVIRHLGIRIQEVDAL